MLLCENVSVHIVKTNVFFTQGKKMENLILAHASCSQFTNDLKKKNELKLKEIHQQYSHSFSGFVQWLNCSFRAQAGLNVLCYKETVNTHRPHTEERWGVCVCVCVQQPVNFATRPPH